MNDRHAAQSIADTLAAQGIHTLLVQFTDLHGVAKGKLLPLQQLPQVLTSGAGFAGPSIAGTGLSRMGPRSEYFARGDASTLQPLPWMPGVARIVGDGFVDGQPFDACPRQILRRATARLAQRGWSLQVGIEPEFFLLKRTPQGYAPFDDQDRLDAPSYDLKSLARQAGLLHELRSALEACGLRVEQMDHEDARGQFEVNFAHADALTSADHLMLFKLAAHAIAEQHGAVFSMMPKPFADQPGSGMHMHVSLWQGADCVFAPGAATRTSSAMATEELSLLGRQFMAGVLAHSAALAALAAPTVNSYKRLGAGASASGSTWAPTYAAHGSNNRTALLRTLPGRFEWRLPDASCNPYIALAGLITAGLDGIDRQLDPGAACARDLYAEPVAGGANALPANLEQALRALEADAVVLGALGAEAAPVFLALKRVEWQAYVQQVSHWELDRYAERF